MTPKLFFQALTKFSLGVVLVGALIFLPAGTLNFPKGILLMCVLFIPILIAGIVMIIKNPELLKNGKSLICVCKSGNIFILKPALPAS